MGRISPPGPRFSFRRGVCVWQHRAAPACWQFCCSGHLRGHRHPERGFEIRPGDVMELHWSRKHWGGLGLLALSGFPASPCRWEAAWQGLWVDCCEVWGQQWGLGTAVRFGDSAPQCHRAEQGPHTAALGVPSEPCLYPHLYPFPDGSSGKPGVFPEEISWENASPRGSWNDRTAQRALGMEHNTDTLVLKQLSGKFMDGILWKFASPTSQKLIPD